MFSARFYNVFKCGALVSGFGFVWLVWFFLLIIYLLISLLTTKIQESKPECYF